MLFATQRKTRLLAFAIVCIACIVGIFLIPAEAAAYDFTPPTNAVKVCEGQYEGITYRVVRCMQDTILSAVNSILGTLFSQFFGALSACMSLAVAIWGFQMATGRSRMALKDGGVLLLKMAALVLLFGTASMNYQELFGKSLDIINDLLSMVTSYVSFSPSIDLTCAPQGGSDHFAIWDRVDCALDILIGGLIPGSTLKLGITAFLLAAMLTNAAGFFIGLLGFFMIVQVVFAVARAVYIYILSYFALSMMALVAPIFLPMILFNFTRGYFEKWLRLTFGYILQPIFIFVYLAMLLAAFDTVVYSGDGSFFKQLAGNGFDPSYSIGRYFDDNGIFVEGGKGNAAINYDSKYASTGGGTSFQSQETGMAGEVGEVPTKGSFFEVLSRGAGGMFTKVHQAIDRGPQNPDGISPYFLHLKIPTRQIDWNWLAFMSDDSCDMPPPPPPKGQPVPDTLPPDPGEQCRTDYIGKVILSAIMAMITAYMFMQLLDALPFIGSGIAADAASSSAFGFGSMAPPGEGMVAGLKNKISGGGKG